jgi:sulfur carrier protein ThiS
MKVYIQKDQHHKTMKFSGKVIELLGKLKINPETVIVTKNSILVTEEDNLADNDDVEILQVVSGG